MTETAPETFATPGESDSLTRCVRERTELFFHLVDRFQLDEDPELIHDVRVASRRLSEGLGGLGSVIGKGHVDPIRDWLREARKLLGPVRDPDVMQAVLEGLLGGPEKVGKIPAAEAFLEALQRRRSFRLADARLQLSPETIAARREQLDDVLEGAADRFDSAEGLEFRLREEILSRAAKRRKRFRRKAKKAAKTEKTDDLHAARIAGKKIRYTLELADEAGILDAKRELKSYKRVQDGLGDLNDLTVLRGRLTDFAESAADGDVKGIDKLIRKVKRRQRQRIEDFVGRWPKLRNRLKKRKAKPCD